ncbi:MAG TPA: alanine dehydrogenase [Bacteroidales bacterium]|nr:alanine dehydrogenase [Bacteroidales bacterium]HSA43628.1 alanine dehydrogenase [Bacteroidales bacterium]
MNLTSSGQLMPREEMLEVMRRKSHLVIGVPREVNLEEKRIALAPEAVSVIVQQGHRVIFEAKAGNSAHFADLEFTESGAELVSSPAEVYQSSDIILKVAPPSLAETALMKERQVLVSSLQMGTQQADYFRQLMSRKITAIAFEHIRDKTKSFPLVRAMSEIAGSTAILVASEYLSHPQLGKGRILGGFPGISPTEVIILGAGTVGESAARAAMGMGATVKVFDNNIYKLRRIQTNLNNRIFTSIIQPKVLVKAMRSADVMIGAIHTPDGRPPCLITEPMIREMKEGSVIIDVSIDQGGCFETSRVTSHSNPVFQVHGITHYCVPNIASRVPNTASYALSNFFAPILLNMGDSGGVEKQVKDDPGFRHGIYLYNGILTHKYAGEHFGLPFQDIDLLMAAYT